LLGYVYITTILILVCFCLFLIRKLYQYSIIILDFEESLEDSLDILNEKYASINKVLKKPIFFDSLEVRQVISDIRDCHNSILRIANRLTKDVGMIGEIKKENDKVSNKS